MNITVASFVSQKSHSFKGIILLCLLFSLTGSACGTAPAMTENPSLTIVPARPCELSPGGTIPLSASGMPGSGVVYRWTATAGTVIPPDKDIAIYTAPNTPGDVIIKVVAERDGVISEGIITCTVIGLPMVTETPVPTATASPSPTPWECVSVRQEKLQSADIPGEVTIDTLLQGSTGVLSRQDIQLGGTYTGIPEGKYLWVFIYSPIAGLHGRYYPQTRDALQSWQPEPTTGNDARWSTSVSFGAPNECYEVIVMLAEKEASQAIADQLLSWAKINHFPGYELNGPETAVPPDAPGFPDGLVEKASIEVRTK